MADKTAAEESLFWLKLIQTIIALLAVLALFFHRWILVHAAAICLARKQVTNKTPDGNFVKRLELDQNLKVALKTIDSRTVLVYGATGSGKSSQIRETLKGRRGVIYVEINQRGHNEAQKELVELVSFAIGFPFGLFKVKPNDMFLANVFAACSVRPIIIISMESVTSGDALNGVLVMCKSLSYNRHPQDKGQQARFIVDLSSSRAATAAGIDPVKARIVPVHVGEFLKEEATSYVSSRMPNTFEAPLTGDEVAELVVRTFDPNVLTLQSVCKALREERPTDIVVVHETINKIQTVQKDAAEDAWNRFQEMALGKLGRGDISSSRQKFKDMATLLLKGPTKISIVTRILEDYDELVMIFEKDIGLWNADAHMNHPFQVVTHFLIKCPSRVRQFRLCFASCWKKSKAENRKTIV
jgi:hypothetical protein